MFFRCICLMMSALVALVVTSQNNVGITARINQSGQVTVDAPNGLAARNNSSLEKNDDNKKVNKSAKKDEEKVSAIDEIDDDHDKQKEKEKEKEKAESKPRQPKREYTTQQTIQARSTGYRIQAYSDNNYRTAKASAQARARAIAMKFPQYRSYISYNAPTWRLRIGDFKSHGDAQAALSRIRSVFPKYAREMTIVRDHINVWQ